MSKQKSKILAVAFRYKGKLGTRTVITVWRSNGTVSTYRNTERRFDMLATLCEPPEWYGKITTHSIVYDRWG